MKLPRVTIEYQEEETFALGKISIPHIVGFGLYWAWLLLFVFNGATLFYPQAVSVAEACTVAWLVVHPCVLACYGLFLKQARKLFVTSRQRFRNRLIAAVAATVGMALTFFGPGTPEAAQVAIGAAAGVLTGFGAAALVMSFGVSFSVCDLPTIVVSMAASAPVAAIAYAAVMAIDMAAHPAGAVVCLCMPLMLCVLLYASSRRLVDNLEFHSMTIPVRTKPFLRHIGLLCLMFGVLLGILRACAGSALPRSENPGQTLIVIVAAGLFTCFVLIGSLLTKHKANNFLFRTVPPVVAALLALVVLLSVDDTSLYSSFALFASYFLVGSCIWGFLADSSQYYRISAFTVFGLGWSSHSVGAALGQILTMHDAPFVSVSASSDALAAVALVAITLGVALLPSDEELRSTLERGRYCPAFINLSALAPEEPAGQPTAAQDAARQAAPAIATQRGPSGEPLDSSQTAQQSADDGALGPSQTPQPETKAATEAKKAGRFKRKCMAVADRYLLSRKETEVLFLLAKGYKSAAIQENLYISEGTTNTHMRHIYRKLDVHSQKELMDLVESEAVPDEDFG